MAIPEMNGVGAVQGNGNKYELKPQKEQKMGNLPVGQGYGETNDVRPKFGVVNDYGGDIANFAKFKGNDKYDAMEKTNDIAGTIKTLYMQLQHDFPGIELEFAPMPNPQTFGKKREGFNAYKQELNNWKNIAIMQINNARERNTVEVVGDAVEAVNQNTNGKAAMNAALTAGYGEANLEATEEEGVKTRKAVHSEGAATRRTVRNEGAKTRNIVKAEGEATRNTVRQESVNIRHTVRAEGEKTREENHAEHAQTRRAIKSDGEKSRATIQREADRVIDTLDPTGINRAIKGIRDMAAKAGKSVGDFITQHPEALVPGLGVPIWAARKITAGM